MSTTTLRIRDLGLAVLLGVMTGIAGYAFTYAEGFSYLSSDPRACANCHVMRQQYDSWRKASHHAAAVCVECHLPHDPLSKYVAKAHGYHHSKAFITMRFHEPIAITTSNSEQLQSNCLRCHRDITSMIVRGTITGGEGAPMCTLPLVRRTRPDKLKPASSRADEGRSQGR